MTKNQMPEFASRLRVLRDGAGLTQQQLAERAGMHRLTVAKLEQGIREPSWATVVALANALAVTCDAFLEGEGQPAGAPKPGRGRPRKEPQEEKPKRPRGRPRKGDRD
jgi:transcriptional regulator with XRE-family HTH domain